MPASNDPREALARALAVLGSPARLDLLHALQSPKAVRDLELRARRDRPGDNPGRLASSNTVREHLSQLLALDLVREVPEGPSAGPGKLYAVHRPRLYALVETFALLPIRYEGEEPFDDTTGPVLPPREPRALSGPRLVLVHGLHAGRAYPLGSGERSRWIIGRRADCAIALDYDPFVSREHAVILHDRGSFALEGLPSSHNGTWLNWRPVDEGAIHPLRSGDVIGVGRSLLVFADT